MKITTNIIICLIFAIAMNVLNVNYALSEEENSVTASNKKYEEYIKAHGGTPVETTTTIEATTITEDVFANDDKRISN